MECGAEFRTQPSGHSPTGRTIYCSKSCAAKVTNRNRTDRGDGSQARASRKASVRRRRLRHAVSWDGVSDEQILDRDRWMCWICRQRIGKSFKWPHPRSASIDHELSLACGGDDTALNKRAAHLGCNMSRQAGRVGEQIPISFEVDPNLIVPVSPRVVRPPRDCGVCGEKFTGPRCRKHLPVRWCRDCGKSVPDRPGRPSICLGCKSARDSRVGRGGKIRPYVCIVGTCDRLVEIDPLCIGHLRRVRRWGDLFVDIPIANNKRESYEVAAQIRLARGLPEVA